MPRSSAAMDRATAEVIEIVRELLDLEERKGQLEAALAKYINADVDVQWMRPLRAIHTHIDDATGKITTTEIEEGTPNRMVSKPNPLACPFSGCNYQALSQIDLTDHIAGCQPNDTG